MDEAWNLGYSHGLYNDWDNPYDQSEEFDEFDAYEEGYEAGCDDAGD